MDKLLEQKPAKLVDERRVLFAFLDRFAKSIGAYKQDYAQLAKKANDDIKIREQQKVQVLQQLSDQQNAERRAAESKHSNTLAGFNRAVENAKVNATAKFEDLEKRCTDSINHEQRILNDKKNAYDSALGIYGNNLALIEAVVEDVRIYLGPTLSGEYKFDKIVKDFTIEPKVYVYEKDALPHISQECIDDANALAKEIREITDSLPRLIFQGQRRMDALAALVGIRLLARCAYISLEQLYVLNQSEDNSACAEKIERFREECNRNKQAVADQRDREIAKIQADTDRENREYTNAVRNMENSQKAKYDATLKHHDEQIQGARKMWETKILEFHKEFVRAMAENYPADRVNAWLFQFWYHPTRAEDYVKICDKVNHNVMVGMAQINIAKWLEGPTGEYVKRVMMKYGPLFGKSAEEAQDSLDKKIIKVPYTLSIENGDSLLLSHDEPSGEKAKKVINGIAMRMLNSVAACMMRFLVFDAGGYGSFSTLKSLDPSRIINPSEPTVKSIVYGEGRKQSEMGTLISELSDSLSGIEGQMQRYVSIRDFNEKNPLSKQIYKPLLMVNYPSGLVEEDIRTLIKLVNDCSRWGCPLFLAEPDGMVQNQKPEFQQIKNDLNSRILNIRIDSQHPYAVVKNAESVVERTAQIYFYGLPTNETIEKVIAPDLRKRSVEASRVQINLTDTKDIYVQRNEWLTQKADDGIVVPIGYLEGGSPFSLQFDDSYVNAMIMGQTGAGKTNLIHAFLMGVLLRYDPSEVRIFLIDFKKGLDFNIYTKYFLPTFAAIGINSEPEFALAILKTLEREMQRRKQILDQGSVKKIADFNHKYPNEKLSRILFVVDELYVLSERANDELRKSILKAINELTHQGRAFGIHTIVCGQDLEKIDYFDPVKQQCKTRMALHCSDEQVTTLLDESAVAKMHSIDENDPGSCVFSISSGLKPQIERTVFVEDSKQEKILQEIGNYYISQKRRESTKVLHSNVVDNPNHPLALFVSHGIISDIKMNFFLGDPISLERSINLCPTENLWIAGGYGSEDSYDAAQSVVFFSLYSLLLNKLKYNNISIVCSNGSDQPSRSSQDEEKDLFGYFASSFGKLFTYDRGAEIQRTVGKICDEMEERKNDSNRCKQAIWWFVVRPEMVSGLFQNSSFVTDFRDVLINGPKYNIHVVMWNYDIKLLQNQVARHMFKDLVCLEMSTDDLKFVNGADINPVPQGYMASRVGTSTMRFRVYDFPGEDGLWINQLEERIKSLVK